MERLVRRPTLTAPARAGFAILRVGAKKRDSGSNKETDQERCAADLQLRLALLRIGEVAEFAVSRPGGAVTVRAAMAEREPAARSK